MADISAGLRDVVDIMSHLTTRRVRLVAVSKTRSVADILGVYQAGQRHFGENYVNELVDKVDKLPSDIKWHFIGHLQSNKVKKLLEVKNLWIIETVDSEKIAHEIDRYIEGNKIRTFNPSLVSPLKIFVQVKTSDEASKTGVDPNGCVDLVRTIVNECPNLKLCGLMTIANLNGDSLEDFRFLLQKRKEVSIALGTQEENLELSMGMSNDFELAIQNGSTNVRVGTAIFGNRSTKH